MLSRIYERVSPVNRDCIAEWRDGGTRVHPDPQKRILNKFARRRVISPKPNRSTPQRRHLVLEILPSMLGISTLLHVDLQGNARLLWEQQGSISPIRRPWDQPLGGPSASWAVPSRDCRHLAIRFWVCIAKILSSSLEQIQFLLGHVLIQTEPDLVCKQKLQHAA